MWKAIRRVGEKYPILRGMATYSVLWPASNLVQQSIDKTREKYDPLETLRYLVLGTFATAPTVYVWVKLASKIVKGTSFRHALLKAGLDQILFAPVGQTQFYLGITLLEGRPWDQCVKEWKDKLIPTWKVAVCFWPIVQTVNFAYVAEKNRVVMVAVASFLWTIFLSYMHNVDQESLPPYLRKSGVAEVKAIGVKETNGEHKGEELRKSGVAEVKAGGVKESNREEGEDKGNNVNKAVASNVNNHHECECKGEEVL